MCTLTTCVCDCTGCKTSMVNNSYTVTYHPPVYPEPCRTCGRCPTCGKGGYEFVPYNPWQVPYYPPVIPWTVPYPSGPIWTVTSTNTLIAGNTPYNNYGGMGILNGVGMVMNETT